MVSNPTWASRRRIATNFSTFKILRRTPRHPANSQFPRELGRSRKSGPRPHLFADWLRRAKIDSPYVNWYMNYACRDDYGALAKDTSAWAGIHYFSSRGQDEKARSPGPKATAGSRAASSNASAKMSAPIKWSRIARSTTKALRKSAFTVTTADTQFETDFVIFAAPTFLAPYLIENFSPQPLRDFIYSPWLTANLTLDRLPDSRGAEPAWDSVFLDSPTLGYVDATHQSIRSHIDKTVWTFYWALAEGDPAQNRHLLLEKDWTYWKEAILHDLERVHSDIRECVSRIDIMRMGHAMVRPTPGAFLRRTRPHRRAANSGRASLLRQFRPERHLHLRRSPISRRHRRR